MKSMNTMKSTKIKKHNYFNASWIQKEKEKENVNSRNQSTATAASTIFQPARRTPRTHGANASFSGSQKMISKRALQQIPFLSQLS